MHRLVTFLGIPRISKKHESGYESTIYRLLDPDGRGRDETIETPWIAVALVELFHPDEVVIVSTESAWNMGLDGAAYTHGEALVHELRRRDVRVERRIIPTGLTHGDLWAQFTTLKDALRGPAREITLDITHGLRSQPFFAAAAVAFVGMVAPDRPRLRIVYGAHDLIRTLRLGYAPIVDLSLFGEILDWTHDLLLFLKSGRIAGLARRAEVIGRELRKRWADAGKQGEPPRIREFADAVEAFARDLQTIRTGALLLGGVENGRRTPSSAKRLRKAVAAARADVERHLPPLADVLDRIEEMARPLVFDGEALVGEKARDVLAALAQLYVNMGRYMEALTTVREAFISLQGPAEIAEPGLPHYDHERRREVDNMMRCKLGKLFESLAQFRNDLNHAGYQKIPNPAKTLIEQAHHWAEELAKASCAPSVFVNLSNHASNEWSEDQRAAAREFAEAVIDVPFPEVPPDADGTWIEQKAEEVLASLPPETTHALVQGEFTLTMALVKRLQARGIRCLAATSERRVSRTEDGRELREFRFVRFRDYPPLA